MEVIRILQENNCDTSLCPPPDNYETTDNPILPDENISAFDTQKLYVGTGLLSADNKLTSNEEYIRIKKYYMYQLRLKEEEQMIKEECTKIKKILETGSIGEIKEILQKRRQWSERSNKYNPEHHSLCKIESCINKALPSSEYCISHMNNDLNQSLFVKCSICEHLYPKTCSCFYCGNSLNQNI